MIRSAILASAIVLSDVIRAADRVIRHRHFRTGLVAASAVVSGVWVAVALLSI